MWLPRCLMTLKPSLLKALITCRYEYGLSLKWTLNIENAASHRNNFAFAGLNRLAVQRNPRYEGDPLWRKEIKTFLRIKRKAEQEAFSRYGLTYIVDEYLPTKLKETK